MNKYIEKRNSLEEFTREQLIGPGAYNKRYHFKTDLEMDYYNQDLTQAKAINNLCEVITEVPAYQYSTAILFPQTKKGKDEQQSDGQQTEILNEENSNDQNTSNDDDDNIEDTSESLVSKQQNYPNEIGLSFVVNTSTKIESEIQLELRFRRYVKFSQSESLRKGLCIWIPENKERISEIIRKYFNEYFDVIVKNDNYFIAIKKLLEQQDFYAFDYFNLNNYLIENLQPLIDQLTKENGLEFYKKNAESRYGYNNTITIYEDSIIDYIKEELQISLDNFKKYEILIKELEIYNQVKAVVTDLKSVFKSKSATPIWQSSYHKLTFSLPKYEGGKVERKNLELNINNQAFNLNGKVQYLKRGDKLYIKLIIENKDSIVLDENEPPMLNKKDKANLKAYFGVCLKAIELTKDTFIPYNPPQLLDIDEEDNLNKILYRRFLDFGEGFNTSVTWYKENNFRIISTEYIPEQETPNVDYKPSKIKGNEVVDRIPNDEVLSMRHLSTLSEISDDIIIKELDEFVEKYGEWIAENFQKLNNEDEDVKKLLSKQLGACEIDAKRLKRNISLLKLDATALIAFRVMNTAMFMQLHHSILIKNKSLDLKNKLDENYYKNIELISDYKWRAFQLGFILLNIDAFVKPVRENNPIVDVFGTGWPERNEIADLVWFPTGGGKTEAYLGIIAFLISYRRFTKKEQGYGTSVIMRYTLRLLTLQQFQRATLLISALEVIRKDHYKIPNNLSLGENERITIGSFVGGGSLPNKWQSNDGSGMVNVLAQISNDISDNQDINTNLPFITCPWCGEPLFKDPKLENIYPNHHANKYGIDTELSICCNNPNCTFHYDVIPDKDSSIPFRLFDTDIYKFPPTLLFGTVDKFAALANNVSSITGERDKDSKRFFGKGYRQNCIPPELIIQDELHLLLGPLGTAVGLFEKSIDNLCTYEKDGQLIKPKIITSTATTRNTDKQIFALFNRRSEIFPKQGISADDSFFAYYKREIVDGTEKFISRRKYLGILPIGKTQVWMQLRVASIALAHRLKDIKELITLSELLTTKINNEYLSVIDYYHTVLSYFNSLKEVGKTQSQLSHYLPGDLNYVIKNTIPWSFLDTLLRKKDEINYSELTGRLTGEEVKSNLSNIETKWVLTNDNKLNQKFPPEFVISTNMISVGIDVSRFNTMIISSMPRNIAEYIQASSRVARDKDGIVFTVHHPFRSRDISHYQRFKEFHEKFYSYVEPISVTPFATKALDRYLAMLLAVLIRHNINNLENNNDAKKIIEGQREAILDLIKSLTNDVLDNANKLNSYLSQRTTGVNSNVNGIINTKNIAEVMAKTNQLIDNWLLRISEVQEIEEFCYRTLNDIRNSLYISITDNNYPHHWKVSHSLREIAPSTVIKTVQQ